MTDRPTRKELEKKRVMGNIELALDALPINAPSIRENLIEAEKATRRAAHIPGLMLTYLSHNIGGKGSLDLSKTCRNQIPKLLNLIPENIFFETHLMSSGPVVLAGSNQLHRILTHLIINGVEAIGSGKGRIHLAVSAVSTPDIPKAFIEPVDWEPSAENHACLEVTDTGCGISDRDLEKIFDPFFTTKFTGRGLGLAAVLGIVRAWGGAVSVDSKKDQGSAFRILLPLNTDRVPRKSEKAANTHPAQESGTVLLVEDHDAVRKMGEKMLKHLGFSVMAAAGGSEALEIFQKHPDVIRCVITDLSMPDMDGWETISALRKIQPDVPVILASGYDEAKAMGNDQIEKPSFFLQKPYSKDDLKNSLNQVLQNGI